MRWVGYDEESPHAHRVYWPTKRRVSVERNIKFTPVHEEVYLPPPSVVVPTAPAQPLTSQTTTIQTTTPQVLSTPSILTSPDEEPRIWIPASTPGISARTLVGTSPSKSVTEGEEKEVEEELEQHILGALTPEESAPPQVVPAAPKKPAREATPEAQPPRRTSRILKPTEKKLATMQEAEASDSTRRTTTVQEPMISSIRKSKAPTFRGFHPDYKDNAAAITNYDINDCVFYTKDDTTYVDMQHTNGDPKTLYEVQARPDWVQWQEAMDRKINTLQNAGTWSAVPQPSNKNVVGSKWVFCIKRKANGSVDKYKARLVT